ncbi:MAG: hypothetical protein US69_C0013G0020 [candidate division TM6 bacterium GW2011_GWF2_38_10]|nr:MAG: hypothetical protein US69_C0013G0020 [candidate division TM6 bacterium GW2011_GWF2_38_10]
MYVRVCLRSMQAACCAIIGGWGFVGAFHIDNVKTAYDKPIDKTLINPKAHVFFSPVNSPLAREVVATAPKALLQAAKDTLFYLQHKQGKYRQVLEPFQFKKIMPFSYVQATLQFIVDTIEEDLAAGGKHFRIQDPQFLNEHFTFIKWKADRGSAVKNNINLPQDGNIKLTNYVVYSVAGSVRKTKSHSCALYELLDTSLAQKFTKQQILSGIFERPAYRKKVKPLVWLSRTDFEEALMQGSTLVRMPDQSFKIFMVNVCNGIPYNKKIRNPRDQKRYWYFREGKNSLQSINEFKERLQSRQKVVFAGDINNIGIGKIIAIRHTNPSTKQPEVHLGVLADTGGAFINNLYQLDFFLGMYEDKDSLKKQQWHFPNNTQAFLLCKKR